MHNILSFNTCKTLSFSKLVSSDEHIDTQRIISLVSKNILFLGQMLNSISLTENNKIVTVANDGEEIFYNSKYMNTISLEQQASLIAHEASHIALLHSYRAKKINADPIIWNIAADYVVNNVLEKYTEQDIIQSVGLKCPDIYKDKTTEYIYKKLKEEYTVEQLLAISLCKFDETLDAPVEDIMPPKMCGNDIDYSVYNRVADAINASFTITSDTFGYQIDNAIIAISNYPQSSDSWRKHFMNYCLSFASRLEEKSLLKPNRRYITSGVYLPSVMPNPDNLNVNVYIDASCNVDDVMKSFLSSLTQVCTNLELDSLTVYTFGKELINKRVYKNNAIYSIKNYELVKSSDIDITCVVDNIKKSRALFNIVFTNGQYSSENIPAIKNQFICWVIRNGTNFNPAGKCIYCPIE